MPTYEYKCDACGHDFEKFQSITASPIRKCPKCGKLKVRRLISSGAGLIFKGSGFYITDYRSDSYDKAAKSDAGTTTETPKTEAPASGGNGQAAASTESKPATETKPTAAKPAEPKPVASKSAAKASTKSKSSS